jgi:hypothetical protein
MSIAIQLPASLPGQPDHELNPEQAAYLHGFNTVRHSLTISPRGILVYKQRTNALSAQRRDRRRMIPWTKKERMQDPKLQDFLADRLGEASDSETGDSPPLGKNYDNPVEENPGPESGFGRRPKRKQFGAPTRNRAMDAAAAIETKCGKEGCLMVTFTLPGSLYSAHIAMECYSSLIIERLRQLMTLWEREEPDSEFGMLGVYEYQERGALHLHVLIGHRYKDGSPFHVERMNYTGEYLRWEWWPLLLHEIGQRARVDMLARHRGFTWGQNYPAIAHRAVDYQFIQKSVVDYLGKYLSKEDGKQESLGRDPEYGPASWVYVNQRARNWVKEQTLRLQLPPCTTALVPKLLTQALSACENLLSWHRPRVNPMTGEVVGVTAAGTPLEMWTLGQEIEQRVLWITSRVSDGYNRLSVRWRERFQHLLKRIDIERQAAAEESSRSVLSFLRRTSGLIGLKKKPHCPQEWQASLAT